jgi:uncharacterized phage infection (PIP) family protein YhgE
MAALLPDDLIIGLIVVAVAAFVIYMFVRATSGEKTKEEGKEPSQAQLEKAEDEQLKLDLGITEGKVKVPSSERRLGTDEVERARSSIRTLTLKQELLSMVLRRLFEAEDNGEITREERVLLSKGYEAEMKGIGDELKRSEMIVSLNELESIREDIVKKFEATLSSTQQRIDDLMKELKIEARPSAEAARGALPRPRKLVARERVGEEGTEEEAAEAEQAEPEKPAAKSDVDARLDKLKQEVQKELDELDKLELEG